MEKQNYLASMKAGVEGVKNSEDLRKPEISNNYTIGKEHSSFYFLYGPQGI